MKEEEECGLWIEIGRRRMQMTGDNLLTEWDWKEQKDAILRLECSIKRRIPEQVHKMVIPPLFLRDCVS